MFKFYLRNVRFGLFVFNDISNLVVVLNIKLFVKFLNANLWLIWFSHGWNYQSWTNLNCGTTRWALAFKKKRIVNISPNFWGNKEKKYSQIDNLLFFFKSVKKSTGVVVRFIFKYSNTVKRRTFSNYSV